MEYWFWLAIISALVAGVGSFTHKVAVMRKHDIAVLSVYSSVISGIILFFCTLYFAGFNHFWEISTIVAFVGAVTYLMTLILKIESLKLIDTIVFFPVYKLCGPLFAILLGIVFFKESFSSIEWAGLVLSLCVPLLLITKAENLRQKNLRLGLYLLFTAAVIGSLSIALFKYGTDITNNVWLYLLVSEMFTVVSACLLLAKRHKGFALNFFKTESSPTALKLVLIMGITQSLAAITIIFAFVEGGTLGIVYTIHSLYILIPIVLSVIFYNEHWNVQKAVAIALSIVAVGLLG
jgi:drug/metabolite transporter (DMT)-like permease